MTTINDDIAYVGMTHEEAFKVALRWADRGVPAFPVAIWWDEQKGGTGKGPLTKHGHDDATTDGEALVAMFDAARPGYGKALGVGIVPGAAGFVVFDADVLNGKVGLDTITGTMHLPPHTYTVTTASGGVHVWLRKRDKDVEIGNGSKWTDVDVRADAGWVVAPGTETPWGSWERNPEKPEWPPLAMVPADIWEGLGEKGESTGAATSDEVQAFLDGYAGVEPCFYGKRTLEKVLAEVTDDEVHNPATHGAYRIAEMIRGGCLGSEALVALGEKHKACKPKYDAEWVRIAKSAVAKGKAIPCDHRPVWPPPVPLEGEARPGFPVEALPDSLRVAAEAHAKNMMVPVDMPVLSMLAALSATYGAWTEVEITSTWKARCNLYLALVADSVSGKSPGISPGVEVLTRIEEDIIERSSAERREMLLEVEQLKPWRRRTNPDDADRRREALARLNELEERLAIEQRRVVDDVTLERLAKLMGDNEDRMAILSDEGSVLKVALGLYSSGGTTNNALLLKGFDARIPHTADRVADGGRHIHVERPCLTVLASIQPTVVRDLGKKVSLLEEGLLGRFQWVYPTSMVGQRMLNMNPDPAPVQEWVSRTYLDGGAAWGTLVTLRMDHEARAVWQAWHDNVEARLPAHGGLGDVREFAGKTREVAAILAALFARVEGFDRVTADHVRRGALCGEFFFAHARYLISLWARDAHGEGFARQIGARLLLWYRKGTFPGDEGWTRTVRELAKAVADRSTASTIAGLEALERRGWVMPADPEEGYGDDERRMGKASPRVLVNPALAELWGGSDAQ